MSEINSYHNIQDTWLKYWNEKVETRMFKTSKIYQDFQTITTKTSFTQVPNVEAAN